jgi:hypothetical protein
MAKVLVVTPTWVQEDGAMAMRPECAASVRMQVFNGEYEHLVTTDNPYPLGNRNVYHQYLRIREMFLAGEWDALLTLEHDNRLPDNGALQRLYDTPADVVYAPYTLRHGMRVLSTWKYLGPEYTNLGSSVSNDDAFIEKARAAVVWPVSGVGFGCTLMRRNVVERVPFREWQAGVVSAPDMPWAEDCLRAGVAPVGRFDVPVDHWDSGEWIDPYMTAMNREYVALQTCNAYAGEEQRYIEMVEGNRYPLPYDVAWSLAQRGLVREVEADAAGDCNADVQAPATVGTQPGKPRNAKRKRVAAKPAR